MQINKTENAKMPQNENTNTTKKCVTGRISIAFSKFRTFLEYFLKSQQFYKVFTYANNESQNLRKSSKNKDYIAFFKNTQNFNLQ